MPMIERPVLPASSFAFSSSSSSSYPSHSTFGSRRAIAALNFTCECVCVCFHLASQAVRRANFKSNRNWTIWVYFNLINFALEVEAQSFKLMLSSWPIVAFTMCLWTRSCKCSFEFQTLLLLLVRILLLASSTSGKQIAASLTTCCSPAHRRQCHRQSCY